VVSTDSGDEYFPAVTFDNVNQHFLVVYKCYDGNYFNVRGCLVQAGDGTPGESFDVSSGIFDEFTDYQNEDITLSWLNPSVACDSEHGAYLVTWPAIAMGQGEISGYYVLARRLIYDAVQSSVVPAGEEFLIYDEDGFVSQLGSSAAYNTQSGFLVVWGNIFVTEDLEGPGFDFIFNKGRLVGADGVPGELVEIPGDLGAVAASAFNTAYAGNPDFLVGYFSEVNNSMQIGFEPLDFSASVNGIALKTQPAKMSYTEGDTLDLSGLEVTLTYDDSSTEDVAFADFAGKGITASPADGTELTVAVHHDCPVILTCSGCQAETGNLTVSAALSGDAGLAAVLGQVVSAGAEAGTIADPKTASISVAHSVTAVSAADVEVADSGATVTFYGTDSTFTTAAAGAVNLAADGATDVYIMVTAADSTALYYKVVINREAGGGTVQTAAAPTASPGGGIVAAGTQVTLTCATAGAAIHYTLDGSNPTAASPVYAGPVNINTAVTIKAIAVKSGMNDSEILTAAYTIAPVIDTTTVSVSPDSKDLAITADTLLLGAPVTVTVPGNVTDARISVSALMNTNADGTITTGVLPALNIAASTAISLTAPVQLAIPAGATVSAPAGWNGTINVPTVQPASSVSVIPDAGKSVSVSTVIEVGFGDVPLTFSQAVRILVPGQAGKDAGYSRGGVFTKINTVLGADTQAAGDALPEGGEGKIDVGSDLVIWTKHFTKFITYTQVETGTVTEETHKTVTVEVSGLASGQSATVYACSSTGDSVTGTVTGTGSPVSTELSLQRGETYSIGIEPVAGYITPDPVTVYIPQVSEEDENPVGTVSLQVTTADCTIIATVVNQTGAPVPNAVVNAYSPLTGSIGGYGTTDAAGQANIYISPGSYIVRASSPNLQPMADRTVTVASGQTRFLTFTGMSYTARTISGKVLNSSGDGIPNASVWAVAANGINYAEDITDSSGDYTLYVSDGVWTVGASAAGVGILPEITVTVSGGSQTGRNLQMPETGEYITVSGTVQLEGTAVPGATVWGVESQGRAGNSTVTNATGAYSLTLYKGAGYSYTIRANIPGYGEVSRSGVSATGTVDFNPSPSYLKVIFGTGGAVFSGYAAAYNVQGYSGKDFTGVSEITLKTPPGTYTVEAQITGVGRKIMHSIPVSADNTAGSPAIANLSSLIGQVVAYPVTVKDSSGTAISGAFVSVFARDGSVAGSGLTDGSGQITFNIPVGATIKYTAKKTGYVDYMSDVTTVAAGGAVITMEDADSLAVTGSITAPGSISSVLVWATEAGGGWVGDTFNNDAEDSSISYTLNLPKAGSWVVSARAEGYAINTQTYPDTSRTVTGAGTMDLTLQEVAGYNANMQSETLTSDGGAVVNREVGVQLVIPTGAMNLSGSNTASVSTRSTTVIPSTGTARPVGETGVEINATDSSGAPVTTLNNKIEITLDYSQYAGTLTTEQIDALQLAYWDSVANDWVIIPSVNDKINHVLRGYTDHLTKFAMIYPETLVLRGMAAGSQETTTGGGATGTTAPGGITEYTFNTALSNAATEGKVSLQADAGENKIALTPGQIDKIEATGKTMEIEVGGVTFGLNPAALKAAGLDLDKVDSISLGAEKVAGGGEILDKAANKHMYSVMGDIFELSATVLMKDKTEKTIEQFNGSVTVDLPVPAGAKEAAAEGALVVCRYNEDTGNWDPVPGEYDAATNTYRFETDKFSKWALMTVKEGTFNDIAGHWAREDIEYMAAGKYISGMGNGKFAPDAAVTRAQFATMLVNVIRPSVTAKVFFADLTPGQWYYNSVGRAYAAGLVRGMDNTNFAPEDLITREQMAAMICNALKYKGVPAAEVDVESTLAVFADSPAISGWARTSAAQAVSHGILKGKPAGGSVVFAPADRATRAEAAVMLKNLLGEMGKE